MLTKEELEAKVKAGANLWGADLGGADLGGANLWGAKMNERTTLPAGYKWDVYLSEVVPALLAAGGQPLARIAEAWKCHEWQNCPMAVAFQVRDPADVPALYRWEAEQFVRFFDAGLIPQPATA